MEQYPELQDDLSLENTNESLNQLKLASLDDKNWPPDEMPVFPKSDDTKGSPEPITHLRWDDPYYDIARHQIVEVGGYRGAFPVEHNGVRKTYHNWYANCMDLQRKS